MKNKEIWNWYRSYLENKSRDFIKTEFILNKQGEINSLKVLKQGCKTPSNRNFNDAKRAFDKFGPNAKQFEHTTINSLKVSLKPVMAKKEPKVFKTVACCIDKYKYEKIKELAKANGMSMHGLLKNLLEQVIEGNK